MSPLGDSLKIALSIWVIVRVDTLGWGDGGWADGVSIFFWIIPWIYGPYIEFRLSHGGGTWFFRRRPRLSSPKILVLIDVPRVSHLAIPRSYGWLPSLRDFPYHPYLRQ